MFTDCTVVRFFSAPLCRTTGACRPPKNVRVERGLKAGFQLRPPRCCVGGRQLADSTLTEHATRGCNISILGDHSSAWRQLPRRQPPGGCLQGVISSYLSVRTQSTSAQDRDRHEHERKTTISTPFGVVISPARCSGRNSKYCFLEVLSRDP